MKTLLIYEERLGDIIRCLPIARHFAKDGEVLFRCKSQYWPIFDCVTYAWPETTHHTYDRVLDLQIWPKRFHHFRHSELNWMDYIYGLHPETATIDRAIVFDALDLTADPHLRYGIVPNCSDIAAFFGYSQVRHIPLPALMQSARNCFGHDHFLLLADKAHARLLMDNHCPRERIVCADTPADLPRIIQAAARFYTINSAPTVIASAVRSAWWHVVDANAQDDFFHANQNRIFV